MTLFVLACASTAKAQAAATPVSTTTGYIEEQTSITKSTVSWQIDGYASHKKAGSQVGSSVWFLATENYWEVYAGPTWSPREWIELGASAGLEKDAQPWRVEQSLWLGHGRNSALVIVEEGGSGLWFKVTIDRAIIKKLTIGYEDQRFAGRGPRLVFDAKRVKFLGSFLVGAGKPTAQVSVQFTFP